jgi:hypothetical protein
VCAEMQRNMGSMIYFVYMCISSFPYFTFNNIHIQSSTHFRKPINTCIIELKLHHLYFHMLSFVFLAFTVNLGN